MSGWGIFLCNCNSSLPLEVEKIASALRLPTQPHLFSRLPRDEIHMIKYLVPKAQYQRILIGCCAPEETLKRELEAAAIDPRRVHVFNLKEGCFWPHPDPELANRKAARLIRGAIAAAEAKGEVVEVPVKVGSRVLILCDSPAGFQLAERLKEHVRPLLLLDEASEAFDHVFPYPLPWEVSRGKAVEIKGSLEGFRVAVERTQPLDLRRCIFCGKCAPVCHTQAITPGLRLLLEKCDQCGDCLTACGEVKAIKIPRHEKETIKADQVVVLYSGEEPPVRARHTGLHFLRRPTPSDLDAVAFAVLSLIGDFTKPEYVLYNPATCAGGAADLKGCGICITACPYQAISRGPDDPIQREWRRMRIDLQACEGCGACISACPTSSLRFTDPSEVELYARLKGFLAPLLGDGADQAILFHCPEQGRAVLKEAGKRRLPYSSRLLPVEVPCLRFVSEVNILAAFRMGASGVALLGCESCPHGEREILLQKLDVCRTILEAFRCGTERLAFITAEAGREEEAIGALNRFAERLGDPPLPWDGRFPSSLENRAIIADAIAAFIEKTGLEPGLVKRNTPLPYALAEVDTSGCTMCRACVFVCPTHAFKLDEEKQTLELKYIACVACGMCEKACPEHVITLRRDLFLDRGALEYQVVVQDEMVGCLHCGKKYINRRALETIERRVFGIKDFFEDTFAGKRRDLLRMCPDCRGAMAVLEMQEGWEP